MFGASFAACSAMPMARGSFNSPSAQARLLLAVTLAEIRFGIEQVTDARRRAELNDWLTHKVRPMFEQRILAVTEDIMLVWRLLVEQGRKAGHTFS